MDASRIKSGLIYPAALNLTGTRCHQPSWRLNIIKIIKALRLIYLGVVSWPDTGESDGLVADAKKMSADIIDFAAPLWSQYILLTLGFFLTETIWQINYTTGGKQLADGLEVGKRLAWLNRICGVIFILITLALLIEVVNSSLS